MAIYESIHIGLEIDQAVSAFSGLTSTVSGHTTQINEIEQDITYLSGATSGNTQSIINLTQDLSDLNNTVTGHTNNSSIHHTFNEIKTDIGIDETNGSVANFLNEQGNFISLPSVQHSNTTGKNAEQSFQHIDNSVNTETTLTNNDKLAFYSNTLSKFVTITIPNFLIWIKAQLDSYFQLKNIIVNNTAILTGDWVADTTYLSYGYKVVITINGVTSSMLAEVTLGHTESISGNYSPICVTGTNSVTIYSKVNTGITIPTIIVFK